MKRYPLTEIKDLLNEALRSNAVNEVMISNVANYSQFQVVKYLIEHDGEEVYQKDFEEVLKVRKSTVSGILDTMEKNSIIIRVSKGEGTRGKIVKLSSQSMKCKEKMSKTIGKIEEKIIEGISQSELDTFYKVIHKMKENIKKEGERNA